MTDDIENISKIVSEDLAVHPGDRLRLHFLGDSSAVIKELDQHPEKRDWLEAAVRITLRSKPGFYPNDDNIEFYGNTSLPFREDVVHSFDQLPPGLKRDLIEIGLKIKVGGTMGDIHPEMLDEFKINNLGDPRININQNGGLHFYDKHEIDIAQYFYSSHPIPQSVLNNTTGQFGSSADLVQYGNSLPGLKGTPDFWSVLSGKWDANPFDVALHNAKHETGHEVVDNLKILSDKSYIDAYKQDLEKMGGIPGAHMRGEDYFVQNFDASDPSTYTGPNEAFAETFAALNDKKPVTDDVQILRDFPHTATYVREIETHYDKYRIPPVDCIPTGEAV